MALPKPKPIARSIRRPRKSSRELSQAALSDLEEFLTLPDPLTTQDWERMREQIRETGVHLGSGPD